MKILLILLLLLPLNAFALNTSTEQCTSFYRDVTDENVWCAYIEKFTELGITTGYPDRFFLPQNNMTRAQAAVFFMRALDLLNTDNSYSLFVDKLTLPSAKVNQYYQESLTMTSSGLLGPNYSCTSNSLGIDAHAEGNECIISGTPTKAEDVMVKLTVRDFANPNNLDQRIRTFLVKEAQ
jgi:hypothetical protein